MPTEQELETIVNSWNPDKKPAPQDELQAQVLEVMFKIASQTHNTRMAISQIKERAANSGVSRAQVENALTRLRTYEYVVLTTDFRMGPAAGFRAEGYEVFVPEKEILANIVTTLYGLQATHNWPEVWLPKIAKEVGLGEYVITLYYLNKLRNQGLAEVHTKLKDGRQMTSTGLTEKGKNLAEYLKRHQRNI